MLMKNAGDSEFVVEERGLRLFLLFGESERLPVSRKCI